MSEKWQPFDLGLKVLSGCNQRIQNPRTERPQQESEGDSQSTKFANEKQNNCVTIVSPTTIAHPKWWNSKEGIHLLSITIKWNSSDIH